MIIYVKGNYCKDYWKATAPTHMGGKYEYLDNDIQLLSTFDLN